MFDISIPIEFDRANGGYVTVIGDEDDRDYYPISLVDGFGISGTDRDNPRMSLSSAVSAAPREKTVTLTE